MLKGEKMNENSIKVNCGFCGKDMECPKSMLVTSKKHMCHLCFQERVDKGSGEELKDVHVDYPTYDLIDETASRMVDDMVKDVFPNIWNNRKKELKEMPRKELAYEMFGSGAFIALSTILKLQHKQGMKEQKEDKKNG